MKCNNQRNVDIAMSKVKLPPADFVHEFLGDQKKYSKPNDYSLEITTIAFIFLRVSGRLHRRMKRNLIRLSRFVVQYLHQ